MAMWGRARWEPSLPILSQGSRVWGNLASWTSVSKPWPTGHIQPAGGFGLACTVPQPLGAQKTLPWVSLHGNILHSATRGAEL